MATVKELKNEADQRVSLVSFDDGTHVLVSTLAQVDPDMPDLARRAGYHVPEGVTSDNLPGETMAYRATENGTPLALVTGNIDDVYPVAGQDFVADHEGVLEQVKALGTGNSRVEVAS